MPLTKGTGRSEEGDAVRDVRLGEPAEAREPVVLPVELGRFKGLPQGSSHGTKQEETQVQRALGNSDSQGYVWYSKRNGMKREGN